ncbi:uncharacterized protein SAPINGB_P004074 [Magnusiomyces paraingens]|uniref:Uncharacterized protein n=1 Tax=Magnusiomyces paraingens TaxID=2606893 RepID=A0A5E8C019_9ASCO|nr:uncharacterized protein SAPINGB_P004074 [Saprochaete ingens]VVT54435.1 unnamed protein product [Saprochaete ingens]
MSSVKPKPSDEKNQDKEKKTYTFDYLATSKFINFDALKQKSPYPSIRDISTEELEALSTALDMTPISILNANFSLTPEACWHEVESASDRYKLKELLAAGSADASEVKTCFLYNPAGSYHRDALLTILNNHQLKRAACDDPDSYLWTVDRFLKEIEKQTYHSKHDTTVTPILSRKMLNAFIEVRKQENRD